MLHIHTHPHTHTDTYTQYKIEYPSHIHIIGGSNRYHTTFTNIEEKELYSTIKEILKPFSSKTHDFVEKEVMKK